MAIGPGQPAIGPRSPGLPRARQAAGLLDGGRPDAALNGLDDVESVARIGSYTLDIRTGRWLSSKGLDAILGIDAAYDRSVEGWAALIHRDDRARMVAYFTTEVLERRQAFDRDYRIIRPDTGAERWVHGRGVLGLDRSGRPIRMVGTIADITDQRSLELQNQRLAQALVQTHEAVLVTGPAGEFEYANPAFERLMSLAPTDLRAGFLLGVAAELPPELQLELTQTLSNGGPWSGEIVHRRGDGTVRVSEASISPILDAGGVAIGNITVARDVTERHEQARERDRLVAAIEQSVDGIVITDRELRIVFANRAYSASVDSEATGLVGRMATEVAGIGLDAETFAALASSVRAGLPWIAEVNHRNPDGTSSRVEVNVAPIRDVNGDIASWVGVLHDVTDRVAAAGALRASEARLRTAFDTMLEGVAVMSSVRDKAGAIVDFRIEYANASIGEISQVAPADQVGHTLLELFPAHRTNGLFDAYARVVETGLSFESGPVPYVDPAAAGGPLDQILEHRVARLGDGYVLSVRDITSRHRAELEMRRLAHAIEQTADAVVITDLEARIEYVNPAFERVSGYTREEVLGQNPRILKSGVQGPAFYAAMWATLTSGQSFTSDITNRRKDGSLFQEESVVSPLVDASGAITSYVAVKRDVTRERALEATHERMTRERASIARTIADLPVLPTTSATAEAICRQVVGLPGVAAASLAYFTLEGPATPLAFVRADDVPVPLRRLPFRRSGTLRERSEEGPWVEARVRRPWHPYDKLHDELATKALAYAPIRHSGRLVGLMTVSSSSSSATQDLTELLPALLEFAGFAGALIGPAITNLTEVGSTRERIAEIIRSTAFRPVFQPIVDLATGKRAGFEALTRFANGIAPDTVFADARVVGLEAELELATLSVAISAAAALPDSTWLSLNVSPDLVARNRQLGRVLRLVDRSVVLEVTEHVPVADYAGLRAAIARLRPIVRVAVDDAGSGVANFAHIVELRPAFVKLDMGIVRGIETDRTRQALVLGLLQFASESHSQTIAEGVETEAELAMLRELGVHFAQGYLLGRPAPAA